MLIGTLGAVVVVPLLFLRFTPLANGSVTVTPGLSCVDETDVETRCNSRWESGRLVVDISEAQTCGESQQSVAVQRVGSKLFIRTTYASDSGLVAACICRQNFSLAIPGLPEQNYGIVVYNFP